MDKPNCYECKHRGTVPGSCHSSCNHPNYTNVKSDPLGEMLSIFASVGRVPPIQAHTEGIEVTGNAHGIKNGWFNHPYNFDPTWLISCTGFEIKVKKEDIKTDPLPVRTAKEMVDNQPVMQTFPNNNKDYLD